MTGYKSSFTFKCEDFNIEQALECGQCFRFYRLDKMRYKIMAMDRELFIEQENNKIMLYPCTEEEFNSVWFNYFDLSADYKNIKEQISTDEIMQKAVKYGSGIRLLNQDPYEALISFIISQNNNIPRIKGIIERMSEKYGSICGSGYSFPSLEQLKNVSTDDFFALKVGFRAGYIKDALDRLIYNEVTLDKFKPTEEMRTELMRIKGVGRKVADCVLLFSLGKREVFPTDVWVKRVMSELYFGGADTDINAIQALAREKWGNYAGYAQQYLFYYARGEKIGVKK